MIYVATPAEMRKADAEAAAQDGAGALMREAGKHIAQYVREHYNRGRIVAFAGPGNNGGDAFATLAELDARYERIIYCVQGASASAERNDARERAQKAGVQIHPLPENDDDCRRALSGAELAIDALFGTGARLPLEERYGAAIRGLDNRTVPVLAIDIPSGLDASTGSPGKNCVRAGATVALAALKPGMLLGSAHEYCGDIWLADIGITHDVLGRHAKTYTALDDSAFTAWLPTRSYTGDKRSSGAPLVIAGSEQFPGAAVLCARGAARAGAGYVTVATPLPAAQTLRAHLVEQVVVTFSAGSPENAAEDLLDIAARNSSVAIGPGLALDEWTGRMLRHFLQRLELPAVIDASALFHLAKNTDILHGKKCLVTPHKGEFSRLSGGVTLSVERRVDRLREFVDRTGVTTLLKGHATLIYDGISIGINTTGTRALATAGTGDVLTGIIATLLSQGLTPFDAGRVGAYWHGLAGRLCEANRSVGVVAGDIPEALADAIPTQCSQQALRRVVPS